MEKRPAHVSIAGHEYRLVTTLDQATLERLAQTVDGRLRSLAPGQQIHPQALLLVALSLAHELEVERSKGEQLTHRSQAMLSQLLERVEEALGDVDENGEPLERMS